MTPSEYTVEFTEAKKMPDETSTLFNTRLKNLFKYYVRSRDIKQDYGKLCDLIVVDRLKEALSPVSLQFVVMKEGNECLTSGAIAHLADLHVNNKIGFASLSKPVADKSRITETTMHKR